MLRTPALAVALLFVTTPSTAAPAAPPAIQIAGAVTPAPAEQRDAATVLGYDDAGTLVTLREGDGLLICLADDPSDDRFHVACYHRDLEPFMARGRELRAQGAERAEVQERRAAEIASGELSMPAGPRALYSLTGKPGVFDPVTGEVSEANRVFVLYIPYATAESTGLPPEPMTDGAPWIMSPGTAWAHVMVVQRAESGAEGEE